MGCPSRACRALLIEERGVAEAASKVLGSELSVAPLVLLKLSGARQEEAGGGACTCSTTSVDVPPLLVDCAVPGQEETGTGLPSIA